MSTFQRRISTSFRARRNERDRTIRAWGAEIDRWHRSLFERIMGIAGIVDHGDLARIDRILRDVPIDEAAMMEKGLRELWRWSWLSATERIIRAVPVDVWFRRTAPLSVLLPTAEAVPAVGLPGEPLPLRLDVENEWKRILTGRTDRDEAIEIIRQLEFPPPTQAQVDAILNDTTAPDGLDAMTRIKTVVPDNLIDLRRAIVEHVTAPPGASSVQSLSQAIRPLIYRNGDGTAAGINYKAQRIARTEGVRIAEAGLRESMEEDRDLFEGIEWVSAHVPDTRPEHAAQEGVYRKTPGGWVRGDGNPLPVIPLGPNCLCWTTPVLTDDLTAGLPAENLGAYDAARARFEKERAK
jgi:hypothetical protein